MLEHPEGAIEYVTHPGDDALPWVVFLHEGLGSAAQWGGLPALVARKTGSPVLVFSRHGYGGSGGTGPVGPDYLHTQATEVLPWVLDRLGIERPILVGHSDGATIAAIHACGGSVRGIVLLAPHVMIEELTLEGIRDAQEGYELRVRPSLAAFHEDPDAVFDHWTSVWLSHEFRSFDIRPALHEIYSPVLVVQGEGDEYGSRQQVTEVIDRVSGNADSLLLPGFGHHPHLQDPERIAGVVADFVAVTGGGRTAVPVPDNEEQS